MAGYTMGQKCVLGAQEVMTAALPNSASVAGLMLTTEVKITELSEEKKELAIPGSGYSHSMEGMYGLDRPL